MRIAREGATLLEQLRVNKKHMTQAELAKASGVSRMTIINIENRRNDNPGVETLYALAKALGTTMEKLYEDISKGCGEDTAN